MIEYYSKSDIVYYGNTEILDFTQNLVRCVLEYTRIRMLNEKQDYDRYRDLKERFLMEPIPTTVQINPLVKIIYYDYLGLTYKRLYRLNDDPSDLQSFQRRWGMLVSVKPQHIASQSEIWKNVSINIQTGGSRTMSEKEHLWCTRVLNYANSRVPQTHWCRERWHAGWYRSR